MKLFKRFMRLFKNCALLLGAIIIGTHTMQSISLSNEARKRIVYSVNQQQEEETNFSFSDLKDVIVRQNENNTTAKERYLTNRAELIKHKANQIELKKQELERMSEQGYALTGDMSIDALTLARYKLRKECMKYDLDISKFASEEEIMRMADIYVKKAEGIKLTDDEMQFYAVMKGKSKKLNKVIESQEQEIISEQIAYQKRYEKQQTRSDGLKHLLRGYEAYNKPSYSEQLGDNVVKLLRGNKTIYVFKSQEDFIKSKNDYMTKIAENPYGCIIAIENQKNKSGYTRLDPILIDKINNSGVFIDDTIISQGTVEIYLTDNAQKNRITRDLLPLKANGEIDDSQEATYAFKPETKRSDKMAEQGGVIKKFVLDYLKPKQQKQYEQRLKSLK